MDKVLTSGQFTQSTFSLWLRDGKSGGSVSVTFQLHPFGDDLAISCLLLGSRFISGAPFFCAQQLKGWRRKCQNPENKPLSSSSGFSSSKCEIAKLDRLQFRESKAGRENCSFFFSSFFPFGLRKHGVISKSDFRHRTHGRKPKLVWTFIDSRMTTVLAILFD